MNIPLKWRRNGKNIAYSVFFHKLTKPYLTSLCTSPFPRKVRALTKPTLLTPILHSKLKISCLCPPFIFNTGSKPNIYYLSQLVNSILGWTRTCYTSAYLGTRIRFNESYKSETYSFYRSVALQTPITSLIFLEFGF